MPLWLTGLILAVSAGSLAILWAVSPEHARTVLRVAASMWIASTLLTLPLLIAR